MKRVVLFTPTGYLGGKIKEFLCGCTDIYLKTISRNENLAKINEMYDTMIYTAALTPYRNPSVVAYIEDNVNTVTRMLQFAREHGIDRIIYISSDEIYGRLVCELCNEFSDIINPSNYAISKYLAEKLIEESGLRYYILRLPGIVGGSNRINFLNNIIDKLSRNKDITCYNLKKRFNNTIYIYDLLDFIYCLIGKGDSSANEIFLLGLVESIILYDVIDYARQKLNSKSNIYEVPNNGNRYFLLDVSKAVKYGYKSIDIYKMIDILCIERNTLSEMEI